MSVSLSTTIRGKRDFLGPLLRYRSIFSVQFPLINEHLFCKYFVRLSVGNATKGFATYGCFHPCLDIKGYLHEVDLTSFETKIFLSKNSLYFHITLMFFLSRSDMFKILKASNQGL